MRILLIDDCRSEEIIQITYGSRPTHVARTFDEGVAALKEGNWDLVYLDHDLAEDDPNKTGLGIMNFLEANQEFLPKEITMVTANPVGRRQMLVVYGKLYV